MSIDHKAPVLIPLTANAMRKRELTIRPILVKLNLCEPFRCLWTIPAEFHTVIAAAKEARANGDVRANEEGILAAMRTFIVPEDRERYDAGADADPTSPEHIDVEIVGVQARSLVDAIARVQAEMEAALADGTEI